MSGTWHRVKDVRAFLAEEGVKSVGIHSFTWKVLHHHACVRCGLLPLKNDATRRAMREPCVVYEDAPPRGRRG